MSLQESVKIPVAVLKAGETRHARLDIEFPDAPVTFTLIQVNISIIYCNVSKCEFTIYGVHKEKN